MAVALTVSAVAAYYSIVGLTAIFAAAVIPVIVMGATLEVAKVTAAIWLHSFWSEAAILTKAYLTCAIVALMLITSMGIFGFLSKAHIEQAASSSGLVAQIERVDNEILREQQKIERANIAIASFDDRVADADVDIQSRIEAQERLINDITNRLERDISVQNDLIAQQSGGLQPIQEELDRVRSQRDEFSVAQRQADVRTLQAIVGANVDGVLGPDTRRRIAEYSANLDTRQTELLDRLSQIQAQENPNITAARTEISRLQQTANAEIARAQEAINAFREQLITVTTADNTDALVEQEQLIDAANIEIDNLLTRKFELESDLRLLEVEVGPVKYIAEMVYGETSPDLLEEAVRWVIVIIVLVFDPLAVVLVLAGLSILHKKTVDNPVDLLHNNKNVDADQQPPMVDDTKPSPSRATEIDAPKPQGNMLRVKRILPQNRTNNDQ